MKEITDWPIPELKGVEKKQKKSKPKPDEPIPRKKTRGKGTRATAESSALRAGLQEECSSISSGSEQSQESVDSGEAQAVSTCTLTPLDGELLAAPESSKLRCSSAPHQSPNLSRVQAL